MTSDNTFFFINHNYGNDLPGCGHNVGNKYIQHAIFLLLLGHIPDVFEGIINVWDVDPNLIIPLADYINSNFKVAVWNLQDQIRPSISYYGSDTDLIFGKVNSLLSKLTIPVLAIGLGINWFKGIDTIDHLIDELTPNCKEFVRILSSKTRFIGIRGHLTKSILERLGVHNTIIIGCPTMHLHKRAWRQQRQPDDPIRVLTNITSIISDTRQGLEFSVMNQDSIDNLHELADKTDVSVYPTLLDMNDWEDLTREHDIVISTRMHQTIMALNQGVPALCYNGDMRAFEMLTFMGLDIQYHPHTSHIRTGLLTFQRDRFDARMHEIRPIWNQFLTKNNIDLMIISDKE